MECKGRTAPGVIMAESKVLVWFGVTRMDRIRKVQIRGAVWSGSWEINENHIFSD